MTDELARAIAPYDPWVWVSAHRPEKAGPAVEALKRYGLFKGISSDPAEAAIDWAGQIEWFVSAPSMQCTWLPAGRVVAFADGSIGTCCLDGDGKGVVGNLDDDLLKLKTSPYELCNTCHQKIVVNDNT
jgi:hypothetical protein